jgi:hypothetical protein
MIPGLWLAILLGGKGGFVVVFAGKIYSGNII